jgi:hypothetical protein
MDKHFVIGGQHWFISFLDTIAILILLLLLISYAFLHPGCLELQSSPLLTPLHRQLLRVPVQPCHTSHMFNVTRARSDDKPPTHPLTQQSIHIRNNPNPQPPKMPSTFLLVLTISATIISYLLSLVSTATLQALVRFSPPNVIAASGHATMSASPSRTLCITIHRNNPNNNTLF